MSIDSTTHSNLGKSGLILGLPISLDEHDYVLDEIARHINQRGKTRVISITNTESMYHGLRQPSHGQYIKDADFSLCDGVGVIWAGRFWGIDVDRFNGPILQLECTERGAKKGWRHFYYGGKPGVAEEMARRLTEAYPGTEVCGVYTPPFRDVTPEEDEEIVRLINDSKPDFVWVGLGLLKQERWIAAHKDRINVPWMVGVGAAFDYHSGAVPWAPAFLRTLGLEWLFRLIIQPKLRAKRYWWSAVYVVEAIAAGVFGLKFLRPQVKS
jgi:N-acetylglucosaminyldiphosphoundecaprenol N-acetyl-beta-D-mannosaminyltransferase